MSQTHALVLRGTGWRRVVLAAARLAGFYAIGVGLMLIPFMLLPGGGLPALRDVARLAMLPASLFVVAFVMLAVARRAGLVALWVALTAVWALVVIAHDLPIELMIGFVGWTALAFPLSIIGALGVRSAFRLRVARASLGISAAATMLWAAVLVPAIAVLYASSMVPYPLEEVAAYRIADSVASIIWGPVPFLVAVLSLGHLWTGTTWATRSGTGGSP
jgi:hypothetical protein